jgi:hypothetical protein
MSDQTYNGWTNWATWNFNLWINNDERLYRIMMKASEDLELDSYLVKFLKGTADNIIGTKLCSDLKKSDIKDINFKEVMEAIRENN